MHSCVDVSLLIAFFVLDLIVFSLARGFVGLIRSGFHFRGGFYARPMSKVLDVSDVSKFFPGSYLPNPKDSNPFFPSGNHVDVYFLPRKRSRICAPFVVSGKAKLQPSIEILPDECIYEIFRRLPGGQERSACAAVSKRWLMLLSSITRDEICTFKTVEPVEPEFRSSPENTGYSDKIAKKFDVPSQSDDEEFQESDSNGFLSRCLEGKKASDVRLAAIAVGTSSRGGLGKLSVRGSNSTRRLTNLGLQAIARSCPSLKVLSLWNVSSIGDEGLCKIASGCRSLEKLDLCHCPAITDKALVDIASKCPSLRSVTLESCSGIGNESLKALGSCPNLKHISVRNCPLVGDQGIASMFTSAGHILEKAKLQALSISDISLAVIGHYSSAMIDLTLVDLQNVKERGFWVMGKGQGLQKLKSLSVTSCPGATDLGIQVIAEGSPDLKLFALRKSTDVSDQGLLSFSGAAKSLEILQLEGCHRITQYGVASVLASCGGRLNALVLENCFGVHDLDFVFPLTSLCHSLKSLTIRNCPRFGDRGLSIFGQLCPRLTHLNLSGLMGITDAGILPLIESLEVELIKVNLSGCFNLTDRVVSSIAGLHGETLELLNLDGCRSITDMSLRAVAKSCGTLSELDVSHCGITDSGIAVLAAAEQLNLQVLSLAGCSSVTDKSLPFLVALGRTLVGLSIQHCCGISHDTIGTLLCDLWRCNILF